MALTLLLSTSNNKQFVYLVRSTTVIAFTIWYVTVEMSAAYIGYYLSSSFPSTQYVAMFIADSHIVCTLSNLFIFPVLGTIFYSMVLLLKIWTFS